MKRLRKLALYLVAVVALGGLTFAVPFTEHLEGPKTAVLAESPADANFGLAVFWYDRGLKAEPFEVQMDFSADGRATLPEFAIPTSLGRVLLKRILTPLGAWTACEHCYGPTATCSLFQRESYTPPARTRLAQNFTEAEGCMMFRVTLLPDEAQYEVRPFEPADIPGLLAEARVLIAKGEAPLIREIDFGPGLRAVNPVRVETRSGALLLWMGGNVGYAILPDSKACPAFNLIMISGTKHAHVYRLEKIDRGY